MKKKNFVTMLMSVIGGVPFAIGMCMCLLPEWHTFTGGVILAAIGMAILLAMLIVRRVMSGKPAIRLNGKVIGITALGVVGALGLGVGMCMTMVWTHLMILGIVVGIAGILLILSLIPICKGLK